MLSGPQTPLRATHCPGFPYSSAYLAQLLTSLFSILSDAKMKLFVCGQELHTLEVTGLETVAQI